MLEPWLMISTNLNDCAVMDITPLGNGYHSIFLKRRVDDTAVSSGYLGTRSEAVDNRNELSGYCSGTSAQISTWKLILYDDGFLIQQATNQNIEYSPATTTFNSVDWFLLAGMDSSGWYDTERTDLLIHGGQNGEFKYQTIFTVGDSDKAAQLAFSAIALLAIGLISMN